MIVITHDKGFVDMMGQAGYTEYYFEVSKQVGYVCVHVCTCVRACMYVSFACLYVFMHVYVLCHTPDIHFGLELIVNNSYVAVNSWYLQHPFCNINLCSIKLY